MAAAALTRARTTRGLYLILSLVCLVCVANSVGVKEKLKEMKEQLQKIEQVIEFGKANLESERKNVFEVMNGNVDRVNCIRAHSLVSAPEMETIEDYTWNTNAQIRSSFASMAATVQELESRLEDMKAKVRYLENFPSEAEQLMF